MIVLVCGGRNYGDLRSTQRDGTRHSPEEMARRQREYDVFQLTMDEIHAQRGISCVVQGGASGADYLAGGWAKRNQVTCRIHRADWDKHGKAAGPIRNQQMLDEEQPDMVVAFPGDRGTRDMIQKAERAGVYVMKVEE